ncbi:MAG: N-6 DNA methylase [Planctomycetota bacterium]
MAAPKDTPALRKERGAFFTPPEIADFLVRWAVRGGDDAVLEPSCGDAAFLLPAAARLAELRRSPAAAGQLRGVEVHAASASAARARMKAQGHRTRIEQADFFDVEPTERFDAVVGNPPYIRYQQFSGEGRAKSLRAALKCGVRLTKLASSWAAFVVHASRFLKPDGRLGLVLPAELLTVNYAAPVRRFLLSNLASVRLVLFEELVFPGVLEEVVLLLAEGHGKAPSFELYQARDLADLPNVESTVWNGFTPEGEEKWTPALLSAPTFAFYRELATGEGFEELLSWGETYLGAVTGNNGYFTLTAEDAAEARLGEKDLLRISPPGSKHLRGLSFTERTWRGHAEAGDACYLFYPSEEGRRSRPADRRIAGGEDAGVHQAYKCRVRKPWWRVPVVPAPDLFLTYMDHHRPRLITNQAGAYHLNSLYGVGLRRGRQRLGRDLLPLACLNSVTLLGAEVVGRSYGGGLLKLEPKEADRLPVPSLALLSSAAPRLRALRAPVTAALERGEVLEAVELVDQVLLTRELGVDARALDELRRARGVLFSRRTARGKGSRGKG